MKAPIEARYEGTQFPAGKLDEAWHEVTTTGDWIIPAEEQHLSAHRSEQLNLYHGATLNRLVEIMKFGRVENSSDASACRSGQCLVSCSTFDAAFTGLGCLVRLVVRRLPESELLSPDEDWRKNFLDAACAFSWKGSYAMKAEYLEVTGFLVRDDQLDELARVPYAMKRRRQ